MQWTNKKGKRINNNLQNIKQKTKDRTTRPSPKTKGVLGCSRREDSSCFTGGTRSATIPVISNACRKDWIVTPNVKHRGHLRHRYSGAVKQFMVVTATFKVVTST
jgi:hypothetical protein